MEPKTPDQSQPVTTTTEPWHAPLNRVTTVSKILAAVVFISLPFVGFWLGYEMSGDDEEEVRSVDVGQINPATPVATSGVASTGYDPVVVSRASTSTQGEGVAKLLPKEFFNTPAIRPQTRILAVGDLNGDGLLDAFAQDDYSPGQGVSDHTLDVVLIADPEQGGAANKAIVTLPGNFVPDMKSVYIEEEHLWLSGLFGGVYRSEIPDEVPFFYNGTEMLSLWTPDTSE